MRIPQSEKRQKQNGTLMKSFFAAWFILLFINIAVGEGIKQIILFLVIGAISFPLTYTLNRFKRTVTLSTYLLQTSIFVLIVALLFVDTSIIVYLFLYTAVVVSLLYQDTRILFASTVQGLVSGCYFFYYGREQIFPLNQDADIYYIMASFIALGLILYATNANLKKAAQKLYAEQEKRNEQHRALQKTMNIIHEQIDATSVFGKNLNKRVMENTAEGKALQSHLHTIKNNQEKSQQHTETIREHILSFQETSEQLGRLSTAFSEKSKQTTASSQESIHNIEQLTQKTSLLHSILEDNVTYMNRLSEDNEKVGVILTLIHDITGQINLLSLNASIEAARAGAHGKGFAVVANEVKHLAEETKHAAETIHDILNKVQVQTDNVTTIAKEGKDIITATNASVSNVYKQASNIYQAAEITQQLSQENFIMANKIQESIEGINAILNQLVDIHHEQSKETEEVYHSVLRFNESLQVIASAFEELSQDMNKMEILSSETENEV